MMKQILFFIVLFFSMVSMGMAMESALTVPEGSLTLEEAFARALGKNPGILQAKERIEAAGAVLKQAKSAYLPTVSATAASKAIDATVQPDWKSELRMSDSFKESSAGINLTWLLFDGFSRKANTLAAFHGIEMQKQVLLESRRLLLRAVATAFYQAQLAVEGMVVASQNQKFNQTLEKDARIKWEVGTVPEAEMLNFSVKALQAESDFLTAEQDFKIVGTALAQLMALPGAEFTQELYPVRQTNRIESPLATFDEDYRFAMANRPDLNSLDKGVLAKKQVLRAEKGGYLPKVAMVSGVDYLYQDGITSSDPAEIQEENDSYVGMVASWDIYTGGLRRGKIEEINSEIRRLGHQREELLLSIASAIRESRDRAETAFENYRRQKRTLGLTQRIREHVEMAYRAGTLPLTRLNEAQTDLVRASGAVELTWIQYRIALVNLAAETGRIDTLP